MFSLSFLMVKKLEQVKQLPPFATYRRNIKQVAMTPTREQFKEFIAAVQKAQQKEKKIKQSIWFDLG